MDQQPSGLIKRLEELSLNAWPALSQIVHDGWILRFAHGHTRRANSVQPLYLGPSYPQDKILYCEEAYRRRRQRTLFKISPCVLPTDLDEQLEAEGYSVEATTSVQWLDLGPGHFEPDRGVRTWSALSDDWFLPACRLQQVVPSSASVRREILRRIEPETCFAMLEEDSEPVACGIAVLEDGAAGVFGIASAAVARRRGFGRRVSRALLGWAVSLGAEGAYLQVETDNDAAFQLYATLGFEELYQYWYRAHDTREPRPGRSRSLL